MEQGIPKDQTPDLEIMSMRTTAVPNHTEDSVQNSAPFSTDSPTHFQRLRPVLPGNTRSDQFAPRTRRNKPLLRGRVFLIHRPSDSLIPQSRENFIRLLKMWETS